MRAVRRTRWAGLACSVVSVAGLVAGVAPTTGQEALTGPAASSAGAHSSNVVSGNVETAVCDVEVDAKVVNIEHEHGDGALVDHSVSPVIPLTAPLPAGRVLTSGVTTDVDHFEDQVDFTAEKSQFEEQVTVRFLNAAGDIIGETAATPDLPDATPYAPFAVPSVDLSEAAVAVQVAHAGTGDGPNSVNASCIDFTTIGPGSTPADFIQPTTCPIDGQFPLPHETLCGFLAVPENRDDPASRLINIAFAIVPGDGSHPDPLVYLEGGPGGAPMNAGGIIYELAMGPASDGRDVIFIDQRGTGYAQPNLACVQQEDYTVTFDSEEEFLEAQEQYLADCFERLNRKASLSDYTTVENAADVADLRIALGIEEWNLFGGSYGTDLALTLMRDRPEGVRSVILDSVFPPEVNPAAGDDAIGFLNRLDGIAETCAADPVCDAANPGLRNAIIAAVDNLIAEPVLVSGTEAEFLFDTPELYFDGFFLLSILDFDFVNPNVAAMINGAADPDPAVRQAAMDNFFRNTTLLLLGLPPELAQPLKAEYRGVPGTGTEFADGFFYTVVCAEEFPFETGATSYDGPPWSEAIDIYLEGVLDFFDLKEECAVFDVDAEDPIVNQPVVSALPALVLYTDNDIQTPPEWSELTAESLPNSDLVFFNNLGHVVTFYDYCPQDIIVQFLADPGGELDTSCTAFLPPIYYEAEMLELEPLPPIEDLFEYLDELFPPVDADGNPIEEGGPGEEDPEGEGTPDDGPIAALEAIDVRDN